MAIQPTSTAPAAPSTMQTLGVLLTPLWVVAVVIGNALLTGEIAL